MYVTRETYWACEVTVKERRAWAAGFYDGEGSTGCYKSGKHRYCRATVSQTDKRLLQQFQKAVGGRGRIVGPYLKRRRKPIWAWNSHGYKESIRALFEIWDYLSAPKRQQALQAFEEYEAYQKTIRPYRKKDT